MKWAQLRSLAFSAVVIAKAPFSFENKSTGHKLSCRLLYLWNIIGLFYACVLIILYYRFQFNTINILQEENTFCCKSNL